MHFFLTNHTKNAFSTILMGKDRLALLYLGQAVPMITELSAAYPLDRRHVDEEEARAIDNTLWGVYNLIAFDLLSRSRLKVTCVR